MIARLDAILRHLDDVAAPLIARARRDGVRVAWHSAWSSAPVASWQLATIWV